MKEEFELVFEIEVETVLKKLAKNQFFNKLLNICSSRKITDAEIVESYYLLNKSPSKARVFVVALKLKASIKDIAEICNIIIKGIYGESRIRSEIIIKRKNYYFAKYIKLTNQRGHLQAVKHEEMLPYVGGHVILSEVIDADGT